MRSTTLCYIEQDDRYLMLFRNKKSHDLNEGKWIGVGGRVEAGESAKDCILREVTEETGLKLRNLKFRGLVEFLSERWEDEHMYLYTSDSFEGEIQECDEGELKWIPKTEVFQLPLWEGDRVFLNYLLEDEPFFHLELRYDRNDELLSAKRLPNLILASASPRRYELLCQIGMNPVVFASEIEETMEGETPEEIVKSLSRQKAEDVAGHFRNGEIVIGADTVVVSGGRILGKPATHQAAAEMIRMLAGKTHQVYTGVTIIRCADEKSSFEARKRTFAAKTDVRVYPMSEEEILLYAGSEEPMDKAGAYGIQGSFGAYVEGIDGEYANVVGLPIGRIYQEMKQIIEI